MTALDHDSDAARAPTARAASLRLEGISKRFAPGADLVLDGVELDVTPGEFLVLVGPSGCGKSTLLRITAGLEAATAGAIWLDGRRVDALGPAARDVAMVFQNYALYPHMTVARNLEFPLRVAGLDRAARRARVASTAELLELTPLLDHKPGALSGGQMQRVALGRAIVRDPRLFLFDEPLSNLDARLRLEVRAEIERLHARLGITSVYVTHDQAEAMTLGARLCVLRDGVVQQFGTPLEVYGRPANRFVAGFLGSPGMNLVPGRLIATGGPSRLETGAAQIPLPSDAALPAAPDGAAVTLGLRPESLQLDAPAAGLEFVVERVEHLGTHTLVRLRLPSGDAALDLTAPGTLEVRKGEARGVRLPSRDLHWFDSALGTRLETRT